MTQPTEQIGTNVRSSALNATSGLRERFTRGCNALGLTPLSLLMFFLLGISPLVIQDDYITHLFIISLIFGTLSMGFDLTSGYIKIPNFGYAAFMGVGGYTSALLALRFGLSPWLGMVVGGVVAGMFGFLTGVLTLRLRGIYTSVLAWFLAITLMSLATNLVDLTRGNLGLIVDNLFDSYEKLPYFYTIFVICIITYACLKLLTRSNFGLAFQAVGQNQEAAESSGVNSTKYKIINFTISCGIAGVVGGFYAHFMGIMTPDVMSTKHSIEVLSISYIGGRGSIWGGILTALIIIPLFEFLRPIMEYRLVVYGLLLISVMIYYPAGLEGFLKQIATSIKAIKNRA